MKVAIKRKVLCRYYLEPQQKRVIQRLDGNLVNIPVLPTLFQFSKLVLDRYLHCTLRTMRLLIEGGTPLLAIHRYSPTCARDADEKTKEFPSTVDTAPPL